MGVVVKMIYSKSNNLGLLTFYLFFFHKSRKMKKYVGHHRGANYCS